PEGEGVLEGVAAIGEYLVADYMHRASSRLQVHGRDGGLLYEVPLPIMGTVAGLGGEWDGSELLFGFQSVTVPPGIYPLDPPARQTELWEQVHADIDFGAYEVGQVSYPSRDGTAVTMFLAHKKGVARDGGNPTLLYGYGGFNVSLTPSFNPARFLF